MLRSAASKVMWVGRATVFMVGLAVILALVFGVATTALGANLENFILGKANNSATKVTGLVSNVAKASKSALLVKNLGPGPALDLKITDPDTTNPALKDVAPMKVNSQAEVANLNAQFARQADNADTVDGKHAADFYAQGSQVGDSKHADEADLASRALSADSATTADQADNSQNATNADKLDNKDAADFLSSSRFGATVERSTGIEAGASDDLCYVGEIRIFAGTFAPTGYLFAHGQLLPIAANQTLSTVIGTE